MGDICDQGWRRKTSPTTVEGNSKRTEVREFKGYNSESEYLQHERTVGKVHEWQYVGSTILENWINEKPCARWCAGVALIDILYLLHLFLLGLGTALSFLLLGNSLLHVSCILPLSSCASVCRLIHFPANFFSPPWEWTNVVYWAFHNEFMSESFNTASNLGNLYTTNKNTGLTSNQWEKMAAHLLTRILSPLTITLTWPSCLAALADATSQKSQYFRSIPAG